MFHQNLKVLKAMFDFDQACWLKLIWIKRSKSSKRKKLYSSNFEIKFKRMKGRRKKRRSDESRKSNLNTKSLWENNSRSISSLTQQMRRRKRCFLIGSKTTKWNLKLSILHFHSRLLLLYSLSRLFNRKLCSSSNITNGEFKSRAIIRSIILNNHRFLKKKIQWFNLHKSNKNNLCKSINNTWRKSIKWLKKSNQQL